MKPNIYDDYPVPSGGSKQSFPNEKKKKPSSEQHGKEAKKVEKPRERTAVKKHVRLQNWVKGTAVTDNLHSKYKTAKTPCTAKSSIKNSACLASVMRPPIPGYLTAETGKRSKEEILSQATDFLQQYYESIKKSDTEEHDARLYEVCDSICLTGTYELTSDELVFGAKTAWRNAPRCIGRIQWNNLELFDCRDVTSAKQMFEAICRHLEYATNGGNIRSAITLFRQRVHGKGDFRVWNSQLIRYAGYLQPDGSVIGDPVNVEFTQICEELGWSGEGGRFDVLPLLLQADGRKPEWFEIPPELILEVDIAHPKYDWFASLGLKWYGVPCVSDMQIDVGGIQFTAAPFNGWYMGTEVGARNFGDTNRYNMLETVAKHMGLDTSSNLTLWKDLALIETNIAVLHSYKEAKVTITDHHAAAESFMQHMDKEQRLRGGCPADWVWIVPPVSGSLCPVYHQEMLSYQMKPAFLYQVEAWKTQSDKKGKRLTTVKVVATAIRFLTRIMKLLLASRPPLTILYATETGKAERFAHRICDVFKTGFNVKVTCMEDYNTTDLLNESFLLVVTSTFGNGEAPTNGETFHRDMKRLIKEHGKNGNRNNNNANNHDLWYSVFGLGSTAYPDFCEFAGTVDTMLNEVGGKRLTDVYKGDELGGQEEAFQEWARDVFKNACDIFPIHRGVNRKAILTMLGTDTSEMYKSYRIKPVTRQKEPDPLAELEKIHDKKVFPCKVKDRKQLQSATSSRSTILVVLDTQGRTDLSYQPGDHVAVFPTNDKELVHKILSRLELEYTPDTVLQLEMQTEGQQDWTKVKRMPPCTMQEALSRYLDITSPPTPDFLRMLATYATSSKERDQIMLLGKAQSDYKTWINTCHPNIGDVLISFPSIRVPGWFLLDHLPILNPRYYSISSCPKVNPNEIHITVAVVKYWTTASLQSYHKGVCSTWLEELDVGAAVPAYIKPAPSFYLPSDIRKPVILIGNGTGIAPFRSFWQRRELEATCSNPPKFGKMTLVFGCRHPDIDDIYVEETSRAEKNGALLQVMTAYSRLHGKPKKYVQDMIKENPKLIFKHIYEEEGHVYVCGDNLMAVDVRKTLVQILGSKGRMTSQEAQDYINNMRESGRYHEDLFGVVNRLSEPKSNTNRGATSTGSSNWFMDKIKSTFAYEYLSR
ncbi:nitric oxide synthase, inducible-like isoform X2 [Amphiura filiformis]|uniref:nitric oxide synthase, inducible-like isoform X2 n=1 Tax=Amphiura filiformis TaxID=82378 RepID=UPI003B21B96A